MQIITEKHKISHKMFMVGLIILLGNGIGMKALLRIIIKSKSSQAGTQRSEASE